MRINCMLILFLAAAVCGSPYYYREDKHHSEHHKEYSYGSSQPSSFSTYDTTPQRYYESSHFSSQPMPEHYHKADTSPFITSDYRQYSGDQSSFQHSGYQSSGLQSSPIIPLVVGKSLNAEGIKPSTYVIKQVKVYGHPSLHNPQSSFYSSSSHNSQLQEKELKFGEKEESLYGQHEETLKENEFMRLHEDTTSLYHQPIPTKNKQESLYEQKLINLGEFQSHSQIGEQISGQKEDSLYNHKIEDFGDYQKRGDLEIGQRQENDKTKKPHLLLTPTSTPNNGRRGYEYYEKRIITYDPVKDIKVNQQIYTQNNQKHESIKVPDQFFGKHDETLYGPIANKSPNGFENIHTARNQQMVQDAHSQRTIEIEKKSIPSKSEIYNKPVLTYGNHEVSESLYGQQTPKLRNSGYSLDIGQQEESFYNQKSQDLGQQLVPEQFEIGQQRIAGSLEIGQQLMPRSWEIGQQADCDGQELEIGNFKGQKDYGLEGNQMRSWHRQVNKTRTELSEQKPVQENLSKHNKIQSLKIVNEETFQNKPKVLVMQNVTKSFIINHNTPTKPTRKSASEDVLKAHQTDYLHTGFLDLGQREESGGQFETSNLGLGQKEEALEIGKQLKKFDQKPGKGDLLIGQKEEIMYSQIPDEGAELKKGIRQPIQPPQSIGLQSYANAYNRHETHYNKITQNKENGESIPTSQQKYLDTAPRDINQENISMNSRTSYAETQQKADQLAQQLEDLLAMEDNKKEISQKEEYLYEGQLKKKGEALTTSTIIHPAETQELGIEKQLNSEETRIPDKKTTMWETHREEYGLHYPVSSISRASYSSKKHSSQYIGNQGYNMQPMSQSYSYPIESPLSAHYGGYQGYKINSGERSYINDQPVQKTYSSGSQHSYSSSSGSSQDRHKVIDDFLKELDKDIAVSNHQQGQRQGSYTEVNPGRSGSSSVSHYSHKTSSSHSSVSHSSGSSTGDGTGKTWYQKIGDSIGAGYSQAKDKAKEIVKTVKDSVGYTHS